jgi:hypothetical protein
LRGRAQRTLEFLWTASRPLTVTGLLMGGLLLLTIVGLVVDDRVITGVPAWLKPAKFAASTAIYSLTLAWLFSVLPEWRRLRTIVGWLTSIVFVLEVAIIVFQAWRGTTSHFNVGTAFDTALFAVMGTAILIQTAGSAAVAVALWRQPIASVPLGVAVRAGMIITLLGASSGALMTRPTTVQLDQARATGRMTLSGAHTVGAPDGGPGLPAIGWSRDHGDLRVGHFVGLHAIQLLPLIALIVARRRPPDVAARLLRIAAGSYALLVALLLAQALRGESIASPGAVTLTSWTVWTVGTIAAVWFAGHRRTTIRRPAMMEA